MRAAELPVLHPSFRQAEDYRPAEGTYALLPFRFMRLDEARYVLTNMAGEYVVVPDATLQELVHHRLTPDHALYDELQSKHVIMGADSAAALDLLACKVRTKQSQLPGLTSLFLFVLTLRCEHSCPYCQVSRQSQDKAAFDMTREHADKAIDFVFASPSPSVKVEFQGGEPLLNFELIQWVVCEVERRNEAQGKDIAFVITTNLALINDEILAFCREHRVLISTSLDGPKDLHNANRPRPGGDSYERTIDGIRRVRQAMGQDAVAALMTTTERSLAQPEAIIDEYVAQGFSSIFLRALSPYGFAIKTGAAARYDVDAWLSFYKRGLEHIFALNDRGIRFREEYAVLLLRKMLTPFPTSYVDLQSPAGAGIACLVFNYDGWVYPTDEARMLAEMRDTHFRLGHLETHCFMDVMTSETLIRLLSETMTEGMPMCSDCAFQPYCGSDPVYHYATQRDVVGRKPASGFCHKNMELLRYLIVLLEDHGKRGEVIRSWL